MFWLKGPIGNRMLLLLNAALILQLVAGRAGDKLYDGTNNAPTYQCFRQDFIVNGSDRKELSAETVSGIEEILSGYRDDTSVCQFVNQFVDLEKSSSDDYTVDVEYCCEFEAHDRFTFVRFAYIELNDDKDNLGVERARLPVRTFSEERPAPTVATTAPDASPMMAPSPTLPTETTVPTKAPSQTTTKAPSQAPTKVTTIPSTKAPTTAAVVEPTTLPADPTNSPAAAVTSVGRYAQVIEVPEGTTTLTEEQQTVFTSTIESLEFDPAVTETSCSVEDQVVEGTALTVTYQCEYTGAIDAPEVYSEYTVVNAEEIASALTDAGLPVRSIGTAIDSPVESPVTPPVLAPTPLPIMAPVAPIDVPTVGPVVSPVTAPITGSESASTRFVQTFQVPEGTDLFDEAKQATFIDTIEGLTVASNPDIQSDCSFDDQSIEGSSLTVEYTCSYTGDGAASAPDSYVEYTQTNSSLVTSTLVDAGLPIESTGAVEPVQSDAVSIRYVQDFSVPEGTGPLDRPQQEQFEEFVESLTPRFSDSIDRTECTVEDQSANGPILSIVYMCSYEGQGAANASEDFREYTEVNDEELTSLLLEVGLPLDSPSQVVETASGRYVQNFSVPEGSDILNEEQQSVFVQEVESLTPSFAENATMTTCSVESQDVMSAMLTVVYQCEYEGPGSSDAPRAFVDYSKSIPNQLGSKLSASGLLIESSEPATVAPPKVVKGRYVQNFTVAEGADVLDEPQIATFESVIEGRTRDFTGGVDTTDCTVDDQLVTGSTLSVEYSCEYTGYGSENAPASFVEYAENPEAIAAALAAEGLPIVEAGVLAAAPVQTIIANYMQDLVLESNSVPFTASQRGVLSDSIQTIIGQELSGIESDCSVTNQDAVVESGADSVLSLTYQCTHSTSFRSVDLEMVPNQVVMVVNNNLDLLVAENPSLLLVEALPISLAQLGTAPTSAPSSPPFPESYQTSTGSFVQTFEIPVGGSELDINEQAKFVGLVEDYTEVAAKTIVDDASVRSVCSIDDQSLGDSVLVVEYTCEIGAEETESDLINIHAQMEIAVNRDLEGFTNDAVNAGLPIEKANPLRHVAAGDSASMPASLFSDLSSGKYSQRFRVAPENENTIEFSDAQIPSLETLIESYASTFVHTGTEVNCQIDRQQASPFGPEGETVSDTDSLLIVDYSCEFESNEIDVAKYPETLLSATNADLPAFTASAREIHSDIRESIPLEFRFDQTVASFVQDVTLSKGAGALSRNELSVFSSIVTDYYAATAPNSTVQCQTKKQTPSADQLVALNYDCLFLATSEGTQLDNEPLAFVREINENLEDVTNALVEGDLPILNADKTRATDRSFVDNARFQQVFKLSPGSTKWGSAEQAAFRDGIANLDYAPYSGEASANCSLGYQSLLEFDETLLAVDYLCEFTSSTDPEEIALAFGAYMNSNPEIVTASLASEGLPVEEAQQVSSPDFLVPSSDEDSPPPPTLAPAQGSIPTGSTIDGSPTNAPISELPTENVGPSTQTAAPTLLEATTVTERYVQVFEVQEGTSEFDDVQEAAFVDSIEVLASELTDDVETIDCVIDDQTVEGTSLTVEYSCNYVGTTTMQAPSAFRLFTREKSAEFDSALKKSGIPILSSTPVLRREIKETFRQVLTLSDGVDNLSTTQEVNFGVSASNAGPTDTNTECTVTDQVAIEKSLELTYQCSFSSRSTDGAAGIEVAPLSFTRAINRDLKAFSQSLAENNVPVESVDQVRAVSLVFTDSARFQQVVQIRKDSGTWDASQMAAFRDGMANLDFGPYSGESSASCDVSYQSILEFDESLLALDYRCVFSASTDPADSAPVFGSFVNANLDLVNSILVDEGLPILKVEPLSSPDFLIPIANKVLPIVPGTSPESSPIASPAMPPEEASTFPSEVVKFQQIFLQGNDPDAWDTDEEEIFEEVIAQFTADVEDNTATACDVGFTSVLEFNPLLLSVDFSCSFVSAQPLESAGRFGSFLNENLEAFAEALANAGLSVERADPVSSPELLLAQSDTATSFAEVSTPDSSSGMTTWFCFHPMLFFAGWAALQ